MQKEQDEHEYIIKILREQIKEVQKKVNSLNEQVIAQKVLCGERHKTSLDTQLQKLQAKETFEEQNGQRLQKKLEELEKAVNDQKFVSQQRFNSIQEAMKDRCKSVQEDNNQFRTRITILEEEKSKRDEQKMTIKTQVIIGILVALATSLIMSIGTHIAHFHITYDDGNQQPQTVQTIEINQQGTNK